MKNNKILAFTILFFSFLSCDKNEISENTSNSITTKSGVIIPKSYREAYNNNKEVIEYLLANGFTIDETQNPKSNRKKIYSLGEAKKLIAQIEELRKQINSQVELKNKNARTKFIDCSEEAPYIINDISAGMLSSFTIYFDRINNSITNVQSEVYGPTFFWSWSQTKVYTTTPWSFCIQGKVTVGVAVDILNLSIGDPYFLRVGIDPNTCKANVSQGYGQC